MIGNQNRLRLSLQEPEEFFDIEAMPYGCEGCEVFFRQPKQPYRRIHPAPIFGMRWSRVLLLQMDEAAGRLDQPLEIIGVLRFRLQPQMLEHIMRFVVALLIPASEKADIAGMPRNLAPRVLGRLLLQLFHQPGNSLAFVHGTLSLVSAEMTGNRARRVFPRRADGHTATGDG